MKILSLHITAFGKLRNVDLTLQDGVNVFCRRNGAGKTTLVAFIRAMLYGFRYSFSKLSDGSRLGDAERWLPWQSDAKAGGSMRVQKDGKILRIERYFGAKASQETLTVTEEHSGKALNIKNVGETLLGLTAESFDRSVCIPQEEVELRSNDNFDSQLVGMVQNSEDYTKVCDRLNNYRKQLKHARGDGGEISALETRQFQLSQSLFQRKQAIARQQQIEQQLQQNAQQSNRLQSQRQQYARQIDILQQSVAQANVSQQRQETLQRMEQLQQKVQQMSTLPQDMQTCAKLEEDIAKKQPQKVSLLVLVCGLALLAVGAMQCFVQLVSGICLLVAGVACSVLAFFLPRLNAKSAPNPLRKQYTQIVAKYAPVREGDVEGAKLALEQVYQQYIDDKRTLEALQTLAFNLSEQNIEHTKTQLKEVQQRDFEAQQSLQQLAMQQGALTNELASLNTDTISLEEQLAEVQQRLRQCHRQLAAVSTVQRLLEQAKDNLSVSYLPMLSQQCSRLLNQVTQGHFDVVCDKNFTLHLREDGLTKPTECFSRGTREIALLCFRIALSQMLYGDKMPLLILDDAFVNFDEDNFLRATQLLKQISASTQVVYLTCHNRLGNLG